MREGVFLAPKRAKRKEARGLVPLVARVLSAGLSLLVASAAIRASAGLDDPAPQGEPPVEEATEEEEVVVDEELDEAEEIVSLTTGMKGLGTAGGSVGEITMGLGDGMIGVELADLFVAAI